jgi:uncharacterized protein YbjT (DUF2867 family)
VILAMTGGTGFVGGATIEAALAAGHHVRALVRRPQPARDGVTWIGGDLTDPAALCRGADAVIHIAGVVNAPDRAGFAAGNIAGTEAILGAARAAGVARFVHVSSLAAREPALSDYGWSKAGAEAAVAASGLDWTMVRPPAVYGPGDLEMRDIFRMANWGIALLPPPGRMSVIHVADLARLLVASATRPGDQIIYEVEDASGGMTHQQFARLVGDAVGRRVVALPLPRALLAGAARLDRAVRGNRAKLTPDRAAYMSHADWTADPAKHPPADLWAPTIATAEGLAATAAWYRANRLL